MEYVGIKQYYSKGKEKVDSEDITDADEMISQGYFPIYTDGYKVTSFNMVRLT